MKKLLALGLCLLLLAGCKANTPASTTDTTIPTQPPVTQPAQPGTVIDIYTVNDLHGKIKDAAHHPGVDELTTYLTYARQTDDHVIVLAIGDMWQGSAESNLTRGQLMTAWMNEVDFDAMAMGNHEFDWGEAYIEDNAALAEFPFLGINIYDRTTSQQVDYCESSLMIECGEVQVGIIGAIGDTYSSIAPDHVQDVYFKVGSQLTELVKAESEKLRREGADFIIYIIHDGLGQTYKDGITPVTDQQISGYYDCVLSEGYVDLVYEAHTHRQYILEDDQGVLHLQNGGDNSGGITHVEIEVYTDDREAKIREAELVSTGKYASLPDDPIVEQLLKEYSDQIGYSYESLGNLKSSVAGNSLRQKVAELYYEEGQRRWGDEYDIILGGGFVSIRDKGYLPRGNVTYSQLVALFPFDNELVLCSIQGRDLLSKFVHTSNKNYFISIGEQSTSVLDKIDPEKTYYVIVDSYTSTYAPNRLTEIERYGEPIYARDLLAQYIANGGFSQ